MDSKQFYDLLEDYVRAFFECPKIGLLKLQEPIKNRIRKMLESQACEYMQDAYETDISSLIQSLDIDIIEMEELERKHDDVNEGPEPSIWYKVYRSDGNHTENRLTEYALTATAQEIVVYGGFAFNPYFNFKES